MERLRDRKREDAPALGQGVPGMGYSQASILQRGGIKWHCQATTSGFWRYKRKRLGQAERYPIRDTHARSPLAVKGGTGNSGYVSPWGEGRGSAGNGGESQPRCGTRGRAPRTQGRLLLKKKPERINSRTNRKPAVTVNYFQSKQQLLGKML